MFSSSTFLAGMALSLSLMMAIGPQNAHVLRMGLTRQHLLLTVLLCIAADAALIAIAISALSALGAMPRTLHLALLAGGVAFLVWYGWRACVRFVRGRAALRRPAGQEAAAAAVAVAGTMAPRLSRKQAIGTALALSWLNPHAWVDTAALIGTASLAYGHAAHTFGWGAIAGSALWFPLLAAAAWAAGHRLQSRQAWVWLDGVVAVMMWGCAAGLAWSIVRL